MIKPPLSRSIASLLSFSMVAAQPFAMMSAQAASDPAEAAALREQARRHEYEARGQEAIEQGEKALKDKDYETAVSLYKAACDIIPNAPNSHGLYAEALHGFCKASCRFAEQRITEGRYGDASNQLKLVLDERYNPRCKEAVVILARLETPGYYNTTIGPKFRANVEEVKKLLLESEGFYQSGRYDLAAKRTDQVLNIDPYNMGARKMQEKINEERDHAANVGYTETRSRMLWKVDRGWESPVRKFGDQHGTDVVNPIDAETAGTQRITAKLQQIILPKLEFRDATIREAVEFLRRKSVELDTKETDPVHKGVNIVLRLEGGGGGAAPAAPQPAAPAIPGLEPLPGVPNAEPPPPVQVGNPGDQRITVSLTNIPLIEALRYVTSLANLKFKIEPFAVAIVPQGVDTTVLSTRQWKVRPGFIQRMTTGGGDTAGGLAPTPPADATRGGSSITGRLDAKEFLKSVGVSFPGDASATYLAAGSRLIVRNTPENLDLIDTLVQNDNISVPAQVEIEAKFVEISQNNLKELSFDWLLGAANIPGNSEKVFFGGGTSGTTPATNPLDFGFVAPGGTPVGTNPLTAGNRSGNLAISANAIDALLFGIPGASKLAPGALAIAGVFTDPTFQVVVRALNQKKGVDLLSAPKVTTKSGQRAVIEIIREFRYPTEFDPPQIPQNFGSVGGIALTAGQSTSAGSFPVTPTTPTAFETRNTGVTLEVEPVVGPDGYTIDLNLVPQVVEFEGFINYGSPIQSSETNPLTGVSTTNIITPNVINQPIFSTRKITTSVSVFDGATVTLGGLMREDVQKVEDKTPFIGDIPLIGRLFRSNVDQHIKRNLLIFTTARLINPAGEPVRNEEEVEEEIVALPPKDATITLPDAPTGFAK